MEKQDDMFGDFDQVEVVSEIQAPQPMPAVAMPVVVDSGDAGLVATRASNPVKPSDAPDEENQSSNKKVLIFAAAGEEELEWLSWGC